MQYKMFFLPAYFLLTGSGSRLWILKRIRKHITGKYNKKLNIFILHLLLVSKATACVHLKRKGGNTFLFCVELEKVWTAISFYSPPPLGWFESPSPSLPTHSTLFKIFLGKFSNFFPERRQIIADYLTVNAEHAVIY